MRHEHCPSQIGKKFHVQLTGKNTLLKSHPLFGVGVVKLVNSAGKSKITKMARDIRQKCSEPFEPKANAQQEHLQG